MKKIVLLILIALMFCFSNTSAAEEMRPRTKKILAQMSWKQETKLCYKIISNFSVKHLKRDLSKIAKIANKFSIQPQEVFSSLSNAQNSKIVKFVVPKTAKLPDDYLCGD